MNSRKTTRAKTITSGGFNIDWSDPTMTWLRKLSNNFYQEWLELAASQLSTDGKVLYERGDVVHEAILETLDSCRSGYEFESQEKLHMHIKRAICLIGHVVDSDRCWTESDI